MSKEVFKWVKGYEGRYKISNRGRVYSVKTDIYLSENRLTKCGYIYVALSKDNKTREFRMHRLVATQFIPNPEDKETVNHIDGDKLNNKVGNLEWNTRHENMQHAYDNGLKVMHRGHEHACSKLTKKDVDYIRATYKRYTRGRSSLALAKKYNVSSTTILNVIKNITHVENV